MRLRIRYWLGAMETALALCIGWILVFVLPFRWTARWFGGTAPPSSRPLSTDGPIRRARYITRRLQRVAAHLPWHTTCLVRAVAGAMLLRRRGVASTIRFGVKRDDGKLAAHAWLLIGNTIVLGGEIATDFQPLADMGNQP
jgi:hypothetical protein